MSTDEWEKVLWKKQSFPDNYIPRNQFLSALRQNEHFKPYTYWPLVLAACSITQHLATIVIFLATFIRIYDGSWDPRMMIWTSVLMFFAGYVTWEVLDCCSLDASVKPSDRAKALKSSILVFLALMALSPVLGTLTAATSSDSIWALTACLFFLNILLADYGSSRPRGRSRERLTSVLSMNAAISSSVVLASRLQDDMAVFALILFAVQLFALFPILRNRLITTHATIRIALTVALVTISIPLHMSISGSITSLFSGIFIFVTFIGPGVLVWAQKFKNEIRGPWDVAVPQVNGGEN